VSQLVKTTNLGYLPSLNGSLITDVDALTLAGQAAGYYLDAGNLTGTVNDARLSGNVTLVGNTFNGNSQLVQTTAAGLLPALNGSLITNVDATTLNGQAGSYYLNAGNLAGTLDDARLSSNVTTQGNTFNGTSQLVQTTNLGYLPSLNGSLITDVDALTLAGQAGSYYLDANNLTGTLNDARLSSNVTLAGNTFNGNSQLVQTTASGYLPALDGSLITNVDATTLNGQAGSYYLDLGNATGTLNDTRLSANVTLQGNIFNGSNQLVKLDSGGLLPTLDGSALTNVNAVTLGGQAGSYYLNLANSTGTLNDARLSGNVTLAGNTFNGNSQLVQTTSGGKLPALDGSLVTSVNAATLNGQAGSYYLDLGNATGTLTDANVSDNLTSSLFVGSGSATSAVDLATGEVAGNLKASNLQSVAADLGAANINVNLSNSNGSFVTNLTLDGTITASSFSGALVGNASTASSLAANPTDCSANQFATAIAANGNLTCAALTDGDIPNSITIDLAATATTLAANPTDCSANQFANAIAANGNLTCAALTDADVSNTLTASLFVGSGSTTNAIDLATAEVAGNLRANNLQNAAADLGAANVTIDLSNNNGSFNTSLIVDGTITAATFSGSLTGNASTATALAANPTDCGANQFATTIAASGNLTCATPTLGTDTAGDYVANLTAGNGIGVTGTPGEAWSPSLAVLYGSSANTAVQGNVSLSCASVSGANLTGGGGSITLGAGGSCSSLGFSGTPNFTSVTATGTVQAATLNATGTIQLNGASINTAGTLSNVAYLDQANTLTAAGTALIVSNNAAINGQLSVGSLRIGASATAGYVLTADASGNATWAPQEVQQVWNGTTLTNGGNKIWTGSASTTSGTATIFLTDNGLTGGNAIFGTIYSVQVTQFGGTSATTSYVGTVRSYTAGTKALVIALSTTGTTTANPTTAPNGSVAYVTVIGN
jgi:hypothetical protein